MKLSKLFCAREVGCFVIVALCASLMPAAAQTYEITPFVGAGFYGTPHLQQAGAPNFYAQLADSITYGLAGGFRFDGEGGEGHDEIDFRWMRQDSHLSLPQNPLVPVPYSSPALRPSIALDSFLGDFTHEFDLQEGSKIAPFVTGSLGAVLLSAPVSSATRFAFGIGAGVKVFPAPRWGFRVWVEYQPIVMHTELQSLVCAGGCVVILNGGVINQFQVSIGPAFRF
jgi:opacity protein-like surface antigen